MKVFETNTLGSMELANRIGVPAMCTYMVETKDGVGNLHHVAHYDILAKGRPAFIIQEATAVNAYGYINEECLGIFTPRQRQILKEIVDCVHAYGVKIGIQLNHAGTKNAFGNQKYGPMDADDVIGMREEDIHALIVNFEFASRWAKELGYDFIELQAAQGYLLQQFLSPLTNQRRDDYGNDRTLLLRKVMEGCRDNFEGDIIVRIPDAEYETTKQQADDIKAIVQVIKEAGATAISISSTGAHASCMQEAYTARIRAVSDLPVIGEGWTTREAKIEEIFQTAACDYVLLGSKLVQDPYFLLRWMDQLHLLKEEDVGKFLYRSIHSIRE